MASATAHAILPNVHCLRREALHESKTSTEFSSRVALGGAESLSKRQISFQKPCDQKFALHVQAAGKTTKFQTQASKPKKSEEDEASTRPAISSFLALRPPTLTALQLFGRRQLDSNTVFVTGGSGLTGARIALELLHEGFRVRAGVPDLREAQELAQIASQYQLISAEEAKRLNVVEFNVNDTELTAKAIGNAGKVVVTIGPCELGPTGKITVSDAAKIFEAAQLAKIKSFVLVLEAGGFGSLAKGPEGFFAKLLSFLNVFKKKDEVSLSELIERIVDSEVDYTLIQTGASEGVLDSYGATHNIVIGPEGAALGGKISKLQVASVVANSLANPAATENKIFEISASMDAPAVPLVQLFSTVEVDGRRAAAAEAKASAEAEENERQVRAQAEEAAKLAVAEARAAAEEAAALEAEARQVAAEEAKAATQAEKALAKAKAVSASVEELTTSLAQVEKGAEPAPKASLPSFNFGNLGAKVLSSVQSGLAKESENGNALTSAEPPVTAEKPAPSAAEPPTGLRKLRQRGERRKAAPPPPPRPAAPAAPSAPVEKRKLLGVFQQETTFVDASDAGDF